MNCYNVSYNNATIGKACVEKHGLYVKINVLCQLLEIDYYRLLLKYDGHCKDLGVLLPGEKGMGICTKISAKGLDLDAVSFEVVHKNQVGQGVRMAVKPTLPFEYLDKITTVRIMRGSTKDNMWLQLITE